MSNYKQEIKVQEELYCRKCKTLYMMISNDNEKIDIFKVDESPLLEKVVADIEPDYVSVFEVKINLNFKCCKCETSIRNSEKVLKNKSWNNH